MRINKKAEYFKRFPEHNVNFVMDVLDSSGKLMHLVCSWHVFKTEYNLNHKFYFCWLQLTDAIPKAWETLFKVILTIMAPSQLKIITLYEGPE